MRRMYPILLVVVLVAGCGDGSGPPVDIIVPKGFTGPIWIVLDANAQDIPLVNGRYQVVIPADGVLRVRSFRPLEQWHEGSARYDAGSPLPKDLGSSPAKPETVALRDGGSALTHRDGKEIQWIHYFVGTDKQYHERPDVDYPPGIER